ncbi:MAG: type II toxin-antitoxin system Phd/YefM family antitoxin [Mycobacteriales bacterium]
MTTVGVRELRQRASELLRRVQAGESIEVTDRGRPVALLTPLPEAEPLERLRGAGELIEARADLAGLPDPMPLPSGVESPSAVLERLRHGER